MGYFLGFYMLEDEVFMEFVWFFRGKCRLIVLVRVFFVLYIFKEMERIWVNICILIYVVVLIVVVKR